MQDYICCLDRQGEGEFHTHLESLEKFLPPCGNFSWKLKPLHYV